MTRTILKVTVFRLPSGQYKAALSSDDPALAPQNFSSMNEEELAVEMVRSLPEFLRLPIPTSEAPKQPATIVIL